MMMMHGWLTWMATDYFTKNIDRTWRLFENLEAGMIGMNTGNSSAAETPFGGIKESGYGKESGKDVAIAEYMVSIPFILWSLIESAILTIMNRSPRPVLSPCLITIESIAILWRTRKKNEETRRENCMA
jgi:hypothetical protein